MATNWNDFEQAAPELAKEVRARFEATGLGLLATTRQDGFPRISPVEPSIFRGELWIGMMDASLKARDLQRDPRMALHAATVDKNVAEGDVKLTGRAIEVTDADEKRRFSADFSEANDYGPSEEETFHLFKVDIVDVSCLKPAGDHLLIESWKPDQEVRRVERR
jgi:hypothetical protein